MASPYDILIDIRARAQEVVQATAAIQAMVDKATATGPALATGLTQGQTAAMALTREVASASQAAAQLGSQGAAAASALASSMDRGSAAAAQTAAKVEEVSNKTREVKSMADQASESWSRLSGRLSEGITFGFGTELVQKGIDLLLEVPKLFVEATEKGVEFDKEMETSAIGLGATFRSVAPEKYLNFAAARSAGEQALGALQAKANSLGVDFRSLAEAYSANLRALIEGGVTQPERQIDLISTLIQAATSKGVTGMQALRDSIDILNGRAGNIVLAKELGLENEALKEAAKNGQIYELIMSKIGGYREAADATSTSFAGLQQTVSNLLAQLEGQATLPIFDELKTDLADLKTSLDSIQARGIATTTGNWFGGIIDGLKDAYDWYIKIKPLFDYGNPVNAINKAESQVVGMFTGDTAQTGQYAAQLAANEKIVESLSKQAQEARSGEQVYNAVRATQEAIDRAIQQAASGTGDQKTAAELLQTQLESVMQSIGKTADSTHDAAGAAREMTTALAGSNKELGDMLAKLPAIVSGMKEAANAANLASRLQSAGNTGQKQNILQGERDNILQYINQNAQQLGHGGVVDATSARNVVESYSRDSSNGAVGMPGDAEAVQNIVAAHQKLVAVDQQLAQLARERNDEDKKAAQSATDRSQQEAIFAAQASGDKTHADQLDRAKDIQQEALKISKDENLSWDAAVQAATQYVDLQNKAKDAADAEKNSKKESAAAGREAAAAAREQRIEDSAAMVARKNALAAIRDQLADVKSDPFQTDAQKIPQEIALLRQEQVQLQKNIDERNEYIRQHQADPSLAVKVQQAQGANIQDQRSQTQAKQQEMLLGGGGPQIRAQLIQLQNQWGTATQQIGKSITANIQTALDATSNAIDGLIMGTQNWRQAFAQAGQAIIKNLIQLGVQMVANAVLGRILGKSSATEQATNSATITAAAAPAAATTSISSYGVAAVVGAALAVAAIAAIIAMATSHASGGFVPGSPSHSDNRFAHVASGEFITRTVAAQHYGPAIMHAINARAIPREALNPYIGGSYSQRMNSMSVPRTGFATGGLVGDRDGYTPLLATVSATSPNVKVAGHSVTLIQTRDRSEMLQALQSSEGEKIVVGHVKRNRTTVGIRG